MILWRHGRTAWNLTSRFQGHTDVPLDRVGERQAKLAATALARMDVHAIASSDLVRAAATADVLSGLTGISLALDERLREAYAADWEGLTHGEIRAAHGDAMQRWRDDHTVRPGNTGESRAEVGRRMHEAVTDHAARLAAGETLVVVTHGGAARAAVGSLIGLPPATWRRWYVLDNCGWAVLAHDRESRWNLRAYNRVAPARRARPQ